MTITLARRVFQFPSSQFRFQQPLLPQSFATRFLRFPLDRNKSVKMLEHNESIHNQTDSDLPRVVSGILFSRSVRSSFASFTLAPISWLEQEDSSPPFLVRLQFMDDIKELRSFSRRQYKIGDRIDFMCTPKGRWEQPPVSSFKEAGEVPTTTETLSPSETPSWSEQPRWVVDLCNVAEAEEAVVVRKARVWSMKECQQHQLKYLAQRKQPRRKDQEPSIKKQKRADGEGTSIEINGACNSTAGKEKGGNHGSDVHKDKINNDSVNNNHHGGGKEKRLQAQELVSFLVKIVGNRLVRINKAETAAPPTLDERIQHQEKIRDWFNRADGVLDVAGGCGHVSMALGMEGISSTVVDARASVGKLPKRDRKIWKKSLKNRPTARCQTIFPNSVDRSESSTIVQNTRHSPSDYEYCQPVVPAPIVVPFKSQQAWFGSKPAGYDASFRHPDEADIPVLLATAASLNDSNIVEGDPAQAQQGEEYIGHLENINSSETVLRRRVSALVALHPDEATGEIVEQAVKHRIPFVVVPCCVFARLFPDRSTNDGRPVSSYDDLLDFLQEKDPSIQRTRLSFGGKNIALWSVFPEG